MRDKNYCFTIFLANNDKTNANKPTDNISLWLYDSRKLALYWNYKTIKELCYSINNPVKGDFYIIKLKLFRIIALFFLFNLVLLRCNELSPMISYRFGSEKDIYFDKAKLFCYFVDKAKVKPSS